MKSILLSVLMFLTLFSSSPLIENHPKISIIMYEHGSDA